MSVSISPKGICQVEDNFALNLGAAERSLTVDFAFQFKIGREEEGTFSFDFKKSAGKNRQVSFNEGLEFGTFIESRFSESQLRHELLHPYGYIFHELFLGERVVGLLDDHIEVFVTAADEHVALVGDRKLALALSHDHYQEQWRLEVAQKDLASRYLLTQIITAQIFDQNAGLVEYIREDLHAKRAAAKDFISSGQISLTLDYNLKLQLNLDLVYSDINSLKEMVVAYKESPMSEMVKKMFFPPEIEDYCDRRKISKVSIEREDIPQLHNRAFVLAKLPIFCTQRDLTPEQMTKLYL